MNVTLLKGATEVANLPGDSMTSLLAKIGDLTGLFSDDPDGGLGLVMSFLAGAAAALAVAIALTVYSHTGHRSAREMAKHGIAAVITLALVAFVAYDMRHAAMSYLGINPSKPAVEFEIRLPKAALSAISDTQIELHTDRNQRLAEVKGALQIVGDQSVLRAW
jgi:hypothetical protein